MSARADDSRANQQQGTGRGNAVQSGKGAYSALLTFLVSAVALGSAPGCGDDDTTPASGGGTGATSGEGGSSGKGGSGGKGGSSGSSGKGGAAGSAVTGGSSGSSTGGSAGSAGDDSGGVGGSAGGDSGAGGVGGSDPVTYWDDGVTPAPLSTTVDDRFNGVAFDANSNVYATGYFGDGVVTTGSSRRVVVAKYNSSGQLVTSFGSPPTGMAFVDLSPYLGLPDDAATTPNDPDPSNEEGRDIALQSDGKIIVAARSEDISITAADRTTPIDIVVFRLNTDGTRDNTFNAAGAIPGAMVLNPGNGTNELVYGLSVDAQNRIYVHGHGAPTGTTRTDQDRYVWRLTSTGALDTTFGPGGTGFFTFDVPLSATATLGLSDNQRRGGLFANGAIASAGYTNVAGRNEIVLLKLTSAGVPDTTFAGDGITRLAPFPTGMAEAYGAAIQSNGSIVTTGYGNFDLERPGAGNNLLDMVSFRVTAAGSADRTWGDNGDVVYDVNALEDRGRAILALSDDRILIAGAGTLSAGDKDSMLLLFSEDGVPAEDFDPTGRKLYSGFVSTGDEFFSVAVSPNGRFAAAAGYAPAVGTPPQGNTTLAIVPIPED